MATAYAVATLAGTVALKLGCPVGLEPVGLDWLRGFICCGAVAVARVGLAARLQFRGLGFLS